jgi:hypothetical protein
VQRPQVEVSSRYVREKRLFGGVRKGSHGMVEIKMLCFTYVREKRRCDGVRKGSHGMVESKMLCLMWLSLFFKRLQKGFPGF